MKLVLGWWSGGISAVPVGDMVPRKRVPGAARVAVAEGAREGTRGGLMAKRHQGASRLCWVRARQLPGQGIEHARLCMIACAPWSGLVIARQEHPH